MPFRQLTTQTNGQSSSGGTGGFRALTTGGALASKSAQPAQPKKSLLQKAGSFLSGLVSSEKGVGQDIAYNKNNKQFQQSKEQHDSLVTNLQQRIQQDQSTGKDVTKLQTALTQLQSSPPTPEEFSATKPSTEKVVGDVLGTATDVASVVPGVGAAEDVGKGLVKEAVKKGVTIGTAFGAGQGLSGALQKNKGVVPAVADTVVSAALGGTTGGILGGTGAKLRDVISPSAESIINKSEQKTQKLVDYVAPSVTKGKAGEAVAAGQGTITKGTIFDKIGLKFPNLEKAVKLVGDLIDTSKTKTENINTLRTSIGKEAEGLINDIGKKDHPIVFKELNSTLKDVELPISFKNDKVQAKTLNDITSAFMKIAKEEGGKVSSLLTARKTFDNLVEENFPNLYENGKPTTAYYAVTKIRNAVNDFIEKELPEGFGYKESLKKQSAMYNLIDSMKGDAGAEVGKITNKVGRSLQAFSKKNPTLTKIIGTAAGTIGGAEVAKKLGIIP